MDKEKIISSVYSSNYRYPYIQFILDIMGTSEGLRLDEIIERVIQSDGNYFLYTIKDTIKKSTIKDILVKDHYGFYEINSKYQN